MITSLRELSVATLARSWATLPCRSTLEEEWELAVESDEMLLHSPAESWIAAASFTVMKKAYDTIYQLSNFQLDVNNQDLQGICYKLFRGLARSHLLQALIKQRLLTLSRYSPFLAALMTLGALSDFLSPPAQRLPVAPRR